MLIRSRRLLAVTILTALVAAACVSDDEPRVKEPAATTRSTSTSNEPPPTTIAGTTSSAPLRLESKIDWALCGAMECASIDVPADYDDETAGTISIAINILRAADTDRSLGALLVNPGGPGVPGTELAEAFAFGVFPTELTDNFDIVGFDPRGVGGSEPFFECGASGEQLNLLADIVDLVDEPEEIDAVEDAVELCITSMGQVAGRLHTDFVARDMDRIREALGEEQISYLGYSYGSIIGAWYATLFPERVRAMVIDGVNNPIDERGTAEQRLASAREEIDPLHDLLEDALDACADASCPIFNAGDPQQYYFDAVKKLDLVNEEMADNPDAGFLALITTLYSEAAWPQLWSALADLQERNDPTLFVDLAEFQLGDDPGAANFTAHVNCLDSWALQPEYDRRARLEADAEFFALEDQLNADYPLFAAIEGESTSTCPFYDLIDPLALGVPFDGGGVPILVIGNTSDPVTSFGESEELANEILSNGVLLEVDHPAHTVYPSNSCVNDVVHDVLLDRAFPEPSTTCSRLR